MNFIRNNFFKMLLVLTVMPAFLTSCENDDDNDAVVADNLQTIIKSKPELSIFSAAIDKAHLDVFTNGGGPFTFFAPTNTAFNAIGIANEAALNNLDSNLLVQILTYHFQAVARTYTEIPLGPNATMSTQGGFSQYASRYTGGSAYVNGGKITSDQIKASNGILYIIDRVLLPPVNSALVNLSLNSNYSLFYAGILKAGISSTFTATPVTVFAPTNAAMTAAGYDAATIAALTGTALTTFSNMLKYHVIPQRIFTPDFKTGTVKSALVISGVASLLTINQSGGNVTVKGINNPAALPVTPLNLLSSNGVIHSIDNVLKP